MTGARFDRARDLDHQIRAVDGRPEPAGIGRGDGGVARGEGRDFDRDESVAALGRVIERPEEIGGVLDIADRHRLEDCVGVEVALEQPDDLLVIGGAGGDGLLEDGRVRGEPADADLLDRGPDAALIEHVAGDVVLPGALTLFAIKLLDAVVGHDGSSS